MPTNKSGLIIVDWDLLYVATDVSHKPVIMGYINKEFSNPRAASMEEFNEILATISPDQRFVDSYLEDNNVTNLVSMLLSIDGMGNFAQIDTEQTKDAK